MLEVARVGPGDTVYDLGAGDGRIVVAAAQRFGARAVGVELDNNRFAFASARIRDFGLEPRARMVHGDLLAIDLTPATVVTLYQFPSVNEMLRPAFERQLRSGARVVTLDFPVQGWKASNVLTAQLTDGSQHAIYLYLIGETKKESANMALAQGEKTFVGGKVLAGASGRAVRFSKICRGRRRDCRCYN
jgi:ubiquinone/menaquinone biosynthesis C-methylase UbiE